MTLTRTERRVAVTLCRLLNRLGAPAHLKVIPTNVLGEEWFAHVGYFTRLFEQVQGIEGDIVECGVGGGKSFSILASLTRGERSGRTLWGFDSWCGLPAPLEADVDGASIAKRGAFSEMTPAEVLLRLEQVGFHDLDRIRFVRGELASTLSKAPLERIALLHVDVDLYQSYLDALENLWPKIEPGGIVALDEYHDARWPGAKRAVDEFLVDASGRLVRDPLIGLYYIVKTPVLRFARPGRNGRDAGAQGLEPPAYSFGDRRSTN